MCQTTGAQEFPGEESWKPLLEHEGVKFTYLYYARADGHDNSGLVLMIQNTNDFAVHYEFKIVFRSDDDEEIREASGSIDPNQRKTGSNDGLFWVPWDDQRAIASVGLRGYKITSQKQSATTDNH